MSPRISRRNFIRQAASGAGALALSHCALARAATRRPATARWSSSPVSTSAPSALAELSPVEPIGATLAALERYPVHGIAELHFLLEWHDSPQIFGAGGRPLRTS